MRFGRVLRPANDVWQEVIEKIHFATKTLRHKGYIYYSFLVTLCFCGKYFSFGKSNL